MFKASHRTFSTLLASTAMILLAGVSGTAHADHSVVNAEFCVDATHFRFVVDVDEPFNVDDPGTLVLRIGADSVQLEAGPTSSEVIGVNFVRDTGSLPGSPAFGPEVTLFTNGAAPRDRWVNEDPITDFTITSFGAASSGAFRIEGSVPRGEDSFFPGDFLKDIALRIVGAPAGHDPAIDTNMHLSDIPIDACDNQIGEHVDIGFGVILGTGLIIEDGASIGDFSVIGDQVFIGLDAVIGSETELGKGAQIARDVIIGNRVQGLTILNTIFHPVVIDKGATVGNDTLLEGTEIGTGAIVGSEVIARSYVDPVTHDISVVTIERKAEVGDGATLDFGTVVGRGVMLGDGVSTTTVINHIFHPVTFDKGATVGANSSFGGGTSVKPQASVGVGVMVGEEVFIGPKAVVNDGVEIGDDAFIGPGAIVDQDVPPGAVVN